MSSALIPGQYPVINPNPAGYNQHQPDLEDLNLINIPATGRRRATQLQGRGLEILGHAVEYLVDSRMFLIDEPSTPADAEAVQLLMLLSRQLFAECAHVPPPARRLRHWIAERLYTPSAC
jgi:hypothetical protein